MNVSDVEPVICHKIGKKFVYLYGEEKERERWKRNGFGDERALRGRYACFEMGEIEGKVRKESLCLSIVAKGLKKER